MAVATTLITFMVRAPATTRSISLYGSWDNFAMSYPMSRDVRLGREHWSGCHNFENIICDGTFDKPGTARNGGLRMGGTYWYYYKLDDEIEFHNSSEPSTTRCPLLPGQLVNELHVPYAMSRTHRRNESASSTNSEIRTMDPSAKYRNPVARPTLPQMGRVNTSPTFLQQFPADKHIKNSMSAAPSIQADLENQSSNGNSRTFNLPRKPSLDALLKTTPTRQNLNNPRPVVQVPDIHTSTIRKDKYQDIINWIPDRQTDSKVLEPITLQPSPLPDQPSLQARRGSLLLRSNSEEAIPITSFSEHRRQKSRSRSRNGSARNSIVFDDSARLDVSTRRVMEPGPLSALIEVQSPEGTPGYGPQTGRRMTLEALEGRSEERRPYEKRLPTLPNTPSSAYPQSVIERSPLKSASLPNMEIGSRFSATTIDTSCHLNSIVVDSELRQRLTELDESSLWSPYTETNISKSICSPSIFDQDMQSTIRPTNLNMTLLPQRSRDSSFNPPMLSSALTCTTISSSVSTTPTISRDTYEDIEYNRSSFVTSIRSSGGSVDNFQHYSLPGVENASEITITRYDANQYTVVEDDKSPLNRHKSDISHSDGMQQLLNELSYLSEMIQH